MVLKLSSGTCLVAVVEVGGVRVGYLRAVLVAAAGSFEAAFVALDAEDPIAFVLLVLISPFLSWFFVRQCVMDGWEMDVEMEIQGGVLMSRREG